MAKLIDILVRELKFWPDNNLNETAASFIAQDSDGMIVTLDPGETASASQFNQTDWSRSHWTGGDLVFEIAEDHRTAIIPRAQWQAAVDALKVVEWNGDGLPPIGMHVVVHDDGSLVYGRGESGEVIAHVDGCAVIRMSYGLGCFLPRCLRTPEQIAAEEREKAACELYCTINWHGGVPEWKNQTESRKQDYFKAIDAGYRKQEP